MSEKATTSPIFSAKEELGYVQMDLARSFGKPRNILAIVTPEK
jgi:hypothetical protein